MYESKDALVFLQRSRESIQRWRNEGLDSSLGKFASYFEKQWLTPPFNSWWLGCSRPGVANTNNALEGFNGAIKTKYSGRKRFTLSNYFTLLLDTIIEREAWDRLETGNQKKFHMKRRLNVSRGKVFGLLSFRPVLNLLASHLFHI